VQASFFVVDDFAEKVTDGVRPVETLVPFGQHGHGWEPGPDSQRRVFDASVFIYVGEGFQPWADDLVTNVKADGADVTVIEARDGIDLIGPEEGNESHDDDHDDSHQGDGHDHTGADPHFWLDPDRATQAVENTAAGLWEIDDANATTYTENAAAFADRLAALDATYEERLADRTRDTVLVAIAVYAVAAVVRQVSQ
jgi:zinc transport system substrate-binding protein